CGVEDLAHVGGDKEVVAIVRTDARREQCPTTARTAGVPARRNGWDSPLFQGFKEGLACRSLLGDATLRPARCPRTAQPGKDHEVAPIVPRYPSLQHSPADVAGRGSVGRALAHEIVLWGVCGKTQVPVVERCRGFGRRRVGVSTWWKYSVGSVRR